MQKCQKAPSNGQMLQVGAAMLVALPKNLSKEDADAYLGLTERKRVAAAKAMMDFALGRKPHRNGSPDPVVEGWVAFYEIYFPDELAAAGGADIIRNVSVPEAQEAFGSLVVVIPGVTMNQVYNECARHFKCWRYSDDLDASVTKNDRSAVGGAYAIRLRSGIEADEELKNLSANDLDARGIKGITLLERMLLELKFWRETGGHLDVTNVTLCAGSRYADGRVPSANWRDGKFYVDWDDPDYRNGNLRVREVLS